MNNNNTDAKGVGEGYDEEDVKDAIVEVKHLVDIMDTIKMDGSGKFKCSHKGCTMSFTRWYELHLHSKFHDPLVLKAMHFHKISDNIGDTSDDIAAVKYFNSLPIKQHAAMINLAEQADRSGTFLSFEATVNYLSTLPESEHAALNVDKKSVGLLVGLMMVRQQDSSIIDGKRHLRDSFEKEYGTKKEGSSSLRP